ncbi:MAG: DnaJ domain-containing protein [Caldilineaceae bacterium]|nr:DnaJ domain-containing protein [Caldilineaceae bacterium]
MKDYYAILDVPITATREEIRAQYKQLVRVYHPDRFRDADDKAYAEEKLKQINVAFQVLCGTPVQQLPTDMASAPAPLLSTNLLDFGVLAPGAKRRLAFQVDNGGGKVTSLQIRPRGSSKFFRVSPGKRLVEEQPFPLRYEVTVDTKQATPVALHQEWLEIDLDGVVAHVELRLQVAAASPHHGGKKRQGPPRWWAGIACAVVLFSFAMGMFPTMQSFLHKYQSNLSGIFAQPLQRMTADQLLFTVQEQNAPVLYLGQGGGEQPVGLGIEGRDAVGSMVAQQVAYVNAQGQVALAGLVDGAPQTVIQDGATKTMLAWSPDGTQLAYLVGEGTARQIGLYSVATGTTRYLPDEGLSGVSHYAWSPDSQVLAFDWWQAGERRVSRIAIDGTALQQLTTVDSWSPAWSADGQHLVVSTAQGLYQLDSQGQTMTQLTNVVGEAPSWSADGQWLAYLTPATEGTGQILWLLSLASGETIAMAPTAIHYAWHPTMAQVAYVTGRITGGTPLLYLWTAAPGKSPTLVAEVNDPLFAWIQ